MAQRIFIVVEDVYAERALPRLLAGRCGVPIIVKHLQPCSSKMSRIVYAQLREGARVAILVDAEDVNPADREE